MFGADAEKSESHVRFGDHRSAGKSRQEKIGGKSQIDSPFVSQTILLFSKIAPQLGPPEFDPLGVKFRVRKFGKFGKLRGRIDLFEDFQSRRLRAPQSHSILILPCYTKKC